MSEAPLLSVEEKRLEGDMGVDHWGGVSQTPQISKTHGRSQKHSFQKREVIRHPKRRPGNNSRGGVDAERIITTIDI